MANDEGYERGRMHNAIWMVSENHRTTPAAFREPLPRSQANLSNSKRFRQYVFKANSGYRTRYPLVAAATVYCAGRESSLSWQTSFAEGMGIPLRRTSQNCYYHGSQI